MLVQRLLELTGTSMKISVFCFRRKINYASSILTAVLGRTAVLPALLLLAVAAIELLLPHVLSAVSCLLPGRAPL